ncbi:MAG: NAD-dependent epimerase/dehydratase family protein [Acidimicrobiales bacterium]
MVTEERFLVTGTAGALGAWTVKHLIAEGVDTVAFGPMGDDRRLRLVNDPRRLREVERVDSAAADEMRLKAAMSGVTHIVHTTTALTQREEESGGPTEDDAPLRSLDLLLRHAGESGVQGFAYESSMAVFPASPTPVGTDATPDPQSPLGFFHRAVEGRAESWGRERDFFSVGVRANLVYGPGQSSGPTSAPTRAIAATIQNEPFELPHRGIADFQYVSDVALALIHAARMSARTQSVVNLCGSTSTMASFVQTVSAASGSTSLVLGETDYPVPVAAPGSSEGPVLASRLPTSLDSGVRATLEHLRWAPRDLY